MNRMLFSVVFALITISSTGQSEGHLNLSKDLAIKGYDPVAYFVSDKAVKGKSDLRLKHAGAVYQFSSAENKERFKKNPSHYVPQYGGWCAYAMGSTGEKVSINPETFEIRDGKLYLFYNKLFTNTLDSWLEDPEELKMKADKNWDDLIGN